MFNSNNGYSLADIAAATGNGNGNGGWGDNCWWIILLFLVFGWGWGGYGTGAGCRGNTSVYEGYVLNNDFSILSNQIGQGFATQERKIDYVNNGICSLGYDQLAQMNGINTNIMSVGNAIQNSISQTQLADIQNTNSLTSQITGIGTQLAACCCDLRYENASKFSDLNYRLAEQSCQTRQAVADATAAIIANQDANTRSVLDFLTQDKIASLVAENSSLKAAANNAAQTADIVNQLRQPTPIPSYIVPNPYCNCNNGCGY